MLSSTGRYVCKGHSHGDHVSTVRRLSFIFMGMKYTCETNLSLKTKAKFIPEMSEIVVEFDHMC